MKVTSIGHVVFDTPDINRSIEYYENVMGIRVVDKADGAVFLACPQDRHSVILRQGEAACRAVSLNVSRDTDLGDVLKDLTEKGLRATRKSYSAPGTEDLVLIDGPEEIQIEITHAAEPGTVGAYDQKGVTPNRLGHIAFNVLDPQLATKFFVDVLDFKVSDWMGDFFAFLRCGPDHHTINLLRGQRRKMHHVAFETRGWDHIKESCDILSELGYPLIWGPGRHGVGHNIFIYHLTPDGQIMELYAELDQMVSEELGYFDPRPWHKDKPQRPKRWEPGIAASNQWGIPTPERFRD
ncbi:VOC family protein [Agrobacterium tumefaciens]|uniref:Glyoxalase n=1 Tax=Agrobacterium tumefaciens TaxID=358 RepID=A0AB36EC59_AGRTU|nr:glyoxalase [Agrobacterium tumefaciens]